MEGSVLTIDRPTIDGSAADRLAVAAVAAPPPEDPSGR
jgi:hypothetical protein